MKIGFRNFKKFKDFPMIELAPITLLTGPNNSGKSSFIKASLLLVYNLISNRINGAIDKFSIDTPFINSFSFFNDTTTNYGWGDYNSSLNYNTTGENITFKFTCAGYEFEYEYGMFDSGKIISAYPGLRGVKIKSINDDKQLCIEYIWTDSWQCKTYGLSSKFLKQWAWRMYNELEEAFISFKEYKNTPWRDITEKKENIGYVFDTIDWFDVPEIIDNTTALSEIDDITEDLVESLAKGLRECVSDCLYELKKDLDSLLPKNLIYVQTHNAIHRSALDTKDKNNYVAQTVFEYLSKSSLPYIDEGHKFVTRWLKKFQIGERFLIKKDYDGEIISVDIIHDYERYMKYEDSPSRRAGSFTNLGYMGTGSIQIFIMLLKLAITINECKESGHILMEIEEPEQNLHPALQSLLADMFKEVYEITEGKVHFIVETHSEYLIRRSQVLVAEEHYVDENKLEEKNPFKVYYFPTEGLPYDMKYCLDGCFEEEFGTGFFDEASNLAFKLF